MRGSSNYSMMPLEGHSNIAFYNTYEGQNGREVFSDESSKLRCITKTLIPVYFYSKLNQQQEEAPNMSLDDINVEEIGQFINGIHRFIFGIPESSWRKEVPLINGAIMWANENDSSNGIYNVKKDYLTLKKSSGKSQINQFLDSLSLGRATEAMRYVKKYGFIPLIIESDRSTDEFMDDFIDNNRTLFENSIIGFMLGEIRDSLIKNKSLLEFNKADIRMLLDRTIYASFLLSLANIVNNHIEVDVSDDSMAKRFEIILDYVANDRNDTDRLKRKICSCLQDYDEYEGLNAYGYNDVLLKKLKNRMGLSTEGIETKNGPRGEGTVEKISPNASLRALVELQFNDLRLKRTICSPKTASEIYIDIAKYGGTALSDYVDGCLKRHKQVLVYGSGGMGKTTLSNFLYESLYNRYIKDDYSPVPIIVNPKLFSKKELTAKSLIRAVAESYPNLGQISISDNADVVLFIDGIDEYYRPESLELKTMIKISKEYPALVTGRTEISKTIEYAFNEAIDLKGSIDFNMFMAVFKRYNPELYGSVIPFIEQLKGLEQTPMIAAIIATYLTESKIIEVNQRPMKVLLYELIVDEMINDKLDVINERFGSSLVKSDVKKIVQEYAWARYLSPMQNYEDRLDRVCLKLGLERETARAFINEFTDMDWPNDRKFLHMSIQDYLVSCWVIDKMYSTEFDRDVFKVMFKTPVNRFIGEAMHLNPKISKQTIAWCNLMYDMTEEIKDDDALRNNYQTKLLYIMARPAIIGDMDATNDINNKYREILTEERYSCSPQLAVTYVAVVQYGRMDEEHNYTEKLRADKRFAEIARIMYMVYEGDLDSNNKKFVDIKDGSIENIVRRYLDDVSDSVLKNKGMCELCRTQTIILRTFFENGYRCSLDLAKKLLEVDVRRICAAIGRSDIDKDLAIYGYSTDDYLKDLEEELILLKNTVSHWIIRRSNV